MSEFWEQHNDDIHLPSLHEGTCHKEYAFAPIFHNHIPALAIFQCWQAIYQERYPLGELQAV